MKSSRRDGNTGLLVSCMYVGAGCAKVTSEDEGIVYNEVKVLDDRI